MNRLFIGLGTIACLGFNNIAIAANGSVAGAMPRDLWLASQRNEARLKTATIQALAADRERFASRGPAAAPPPVRRR